MLRILTEPKKRDTNGIIFFILVVIISAFLLSTFVVQLMVVKGESMEPAYHNMQFVLLNKFSNDYKMNDVVAFKSSNLQEVLVKRIVGCPGDSIVISDQRLMVNNKIQQFFSNKVFIYAGELANKRTLNEDEYIVIGDNVDVSKDSRYKEIGIIHAEDIIGIVL